MKFRAIKNIERDQRQELERQQRASQRGNGIPTEAKKRKADEDENPLAEDRRKQRTAQRRKQNPDKRRGSW